MRTIITAAVAVMALCLFSVSVAEGGELDDLVRSLNVRAEADSGGFKADLAARFGVPGTQVEVLLRAVDSPGDAYMCLRVAQVAHLSAEAVLDEYRANKDRGWGLVAKNLGIKPGSRDFRELKSGNFGADADRQGRGKGKGKRG